MLWWALYPVQEQQQQRRQRCQPVSQQTERLGLKPRLIRRRILVCFPEVGCWLFFIPPLLCAKACDGLCLSLAKRSLIFHVEELSGSSSSADYNEQYPFSASCNLSTGVWAWKGSLKAQFVFNTGETVSCSGGVLQGGLWSGAEIRNLLCWCADPL